MAKAKTYDSSKVSVIVGPTPLTGLAEGSFVTVEREDSLWTKRVGRDGEVARSKSSNKSGKISIKVMQTSSANATLNVYYQLDELSNSGIVPILIRDGSGLSLHAAAEAWIEKIPKTEYGKDSGDIEWVFHCAELESAPLGN